MPRDDHHVRAARALHEVIEALDRRIPDVGRIEEAKIASPQQSLSLEYPFMHLRPLHDRIMVRRLDEDSTQFLGGNYLIMKEDDVLAVQEGNV